MINQFIYPFKTNLSLIEFSSTINNPFTLKIPEIAKIAAVEFQEFIKEESTNWNYDFTSKKGKMFGVLVVRLSNGELAYLAAVSGKLTTSDSINKLVPSVFDAATGNYFINKGMTLLSNFNKQLELTNNELEQEEIKKQRKELSLALQKQLFENYYFLNIKGKTKNVIGIFTEADHGKPPSAAGECAAPKLLNFAFKNQLKPVALAEFWWGNSIKTADREHLVFYPACKDKCRPILEYMLDDSDLFTKTISKK